jgi:hypothetical protein
VEECNSRADLTLPTSWNLLPSIYGKIQVKENCFVENVQNSPYQYQEPIAHWSHPIA